MMQDELGAACGELARLAEVLRSTPTRVSAEDLRVALAEMGSVLAKVGNIIGVIKNEVEAAGDRERMRNRDQGSIRDERAIRGLASLSKEDRERLVGAVEAGPPSSSVTAFANDVAQRLNLLPHRVTEILEPISSWYSILGGRGGTEEDVNTVARILIDVHNTDSSTQEMLRSVDAGNPASSFMQHLKRLLRCHSTLGITVKADNLAHRNERQFGSAGVSTDLRPIFGFAVETAPVYGVVVHNLAVQINDGGTVRTISIALTSSDILALADTLDRAYKKERTLREHAPYKLLPMKG